MPLDIRNGVLISEDFRSNSRLRTDCITGRQITLFLEEFSVELGLYNRHGGMWPYWALNIRVWRGRRSLGRRPAATMN